MANKIIHIAIYDLNCAEHGFRIRLGNDHLAVTATTQRVIDNLYDLYSRRASKSHGKFSTAEDYVATQKHLRAYVKGKSDFADLTKKLMDTLKYQAGLRNASQGGHVFFAHFDCDDRQFLLVAIINDIASELPESFWTGMLPQLMDTSSSNSPYFMAYLAAQAKFGDKAFLSRDITVRDLLLSSASIRLSVAFV